MPEARKWSEKRLSSGAEEEIYDDLLDTARSVIVTSVGAACNVCHCGCWISFFGL
jgi:hypothetical protein